jgi:hypothetical protein
MRQRSFSLRGKSTSRESRNSRGNFFLIAIMRLGEIGAAYFG